MIDYTSEIILIDTALIILGFIIWISTLLLIRSYRNQITDNLKDFSDDFKDMFK